MKNLRYVEITKTPICDLSVLKDHKHILLLNVNNTLITDISFIESYERLSKLDVSGCPIEDHTPLLKIRPLDMLIIEPLRAFDMYLITAFVTQKAEVKLTLITLSH